MNQALTHVEKCLKRRLARRFACALLLLASLAHAQEGKDGVLTVSAPNTVLNRYAALGADATAGATSFVVSDVAALDDATYGPLEPGDLVMLYQAQGASIDTSDTQSYGAVTNLNNAGRYEFVTVGSVNRATNTLTLAASCGGLKFSYNVLGKAQAVRVPQFAGLTVNSGASVTAPAWDGQTGGVVALHVRGAVMLNGTVDVSGRGFRGGALDNLTQSAGTNVTLYRSSNAADGAEKGESIAGYGDAYAGGRYGRGAPANGGGGGNAHNAGGGGGANGNNGNLWSGQGVKDPASAYAAAWALDPNNASMNSSGGGRGGYTYSSTNKDAATVAPGDSTWGGNLRRERGGLGGRPLDNDPAGRLFFGGGGGAGDANNSSGGAGGGGGGLVYLIAGSVSGAGSVLANGANGADAKNTFNDAPGGGGGGGTVVIRSGALSGVNVQANGGNGGSQPITSNEAEGPGGGGGGGFIAVSGGSVSRSAGGGANGTTTSASLTEFPLNGATRGASGRANAPLGTTPVCTTAPDLTLAKSHTGKFTRGSSATYTLTVTNAGNRATYGAVTLTDTLPAGLAPRSASGSGWSVTFSGQSVTATRADALPPGSSYPPLALEVDVLTSAPDALTNTAAVAGGGEANTANNAASDPTTITQPDKLTLQKWVCNLERSCSYATSNVGSPGERLEYRITYTNSGGGALTKVRLEDPVPFFTDLALDQYGAGEVRLVCPDASVRDLDLGPTSRVEIDVMSVCGLTLLQPGAGGALLYRVRIR